MFADVLFVVDQFVAEELFEVRVDRTEARNAVDNISREVKTVEFVEHRHIEWGRCCSFLAVAMHVEVVVVGAFVGETVNERGVAVEGEDHRLVRREDRIKLPVG